MEPSPNRPFPGAASVEPDYFKVLGLPADPDLRRSEVDAAYRERSQAVHPDRVAGVADPDTRRSAERAASLLNEAYRTLRDRVRRLEYLCRRGGIDLDRTGPGGAPMPEPTFLADMVERRERLAEARAEGEDAVEAMREGVEEEVRRAEADAAAALREGKVPQAAEALVRRRYLARLLEEIDEGLET